jgi:hypothetical protein
MYQCVLAIHQNLRKVALLAHRLYLLDLPSFRHLIQLSKPRVALFVNVSQTKGCFSGHVNSFTSQPTYNIILICHKIILVLSLSFIPLTYSSYIFLPSWPGIEHSLFQPIKPKRPSLWTRIKSGWLLENRARIMPRRDL